MKRIFMLCLAGALALAATSCKDDNETVTMQTITVNGLINEVKSAFYRENPPEYGDEASFTLILLKDAFSQIPEDQPSFFVGIELSESLYGKTIDLTKPVVKSGTLEPYLDIIATIDGSSFEIDNSEGSIDISVKGKDTPFTITAGTLKATKTGGEFSVKLSVNLSNGSSASVDWTGKATKMKTNNPE